MARTKAAARKTVKVNPKTKYRTGKKGDYEGSCNKKKVAECVKQDKYCNVDTGRCIAPSGVKTKAKKEPKLAVDPTHGIVGKATAVENVRKYLETISVAKQKKLDVGIKTTIKKAPKKASKPAKKAPKKASKPAKKTCTTKECKEQGKLCNKATGNCIMDTAANRRKLGLEAKPAKKPSKPVKKPAKKPSKPVKKYEIMTVVKLKEELRSRSLPLTGNKAALVKRLVEADKRKVKKPKVVKKKVKKPSPEESSPYPGLDDCRMEHVDCEEDELCNVDTGDCFPKGDAESKKAVFKHDDITYYGSRDTLREFAKQLGVDKPKIKAATTKEVEKKVKKPKVKKPKKVKEPEPEPSPEEILKKVTGPKALTKAEKELVEKIRECLGI